MQCADELTAAKRPVKSCQEKLSKQSFDWLIGEVKQKFMQLA